MNANHTAAYQALQKVADRENITVEQVTVEIEQAISAAYANAKLHQNQEILERWHSIPCEGVIPSAAELITYISKRLTLR